MTNADRESRLSELEQLVLYTSSIKVGIDMPRLHGYQALLKGLRAKDESDPNTALELQQAAQEITGYVNSVFDEITPRQIEALAHSPMRPRTLDYIANCFESFTPWFGEGQLSPDPSIVTGIGVIDGKKVMVIGHEKGTINETYRNGGVARAKGNENARRAMLFAETMNIPVVTFIDTPGSYPLDDFLPAEAIAKNLEVQARLRVPHVSVVIGEGGSGGALALDLSDRRLMMHYAYYSVISVKGAAAILGKSGSTGEQLEELAARNLRITSEDMSSFGLADKVLPEPHIGIRAQDKEYFSLVRQSIIEQIDDLVSRTIYRRPDAFDQRRRQSPTRWVLDNGQKNRLVKDRYEKYRNIGVYTTFSKKELEELKIHRPPAKDESKVWVHSAHDPLAQHAVTKELLYNSQNIGVFPTSGHHHRLPIERYIPLLTDKGSFHEMNSHITSVNAINFYEFDAKLAEAMRTTGRTSAMISGYAKLGGIDYVLLLNNFDFRGGTLGGAEGEKFVRAIEYAGRRKLPTVHICPSGGVRIQEGVPGLLQMAKTSAAVAWYKALGGFYLVVQTTPTMAGVKASYASQGVVTFAEPQAQLGFAGLDVIENTVKEKFPRDYQDSERGLARGGVDRIVHRFDLRDAVLDALQMNRDYRR